MKKVYTIIVTVFTDFIVRAGGAIEIEGTIDDTGRDQFILGVFDDADEAIKAWTKFRDTQVVHPDGDNLVECPIDEAVMHTTVLNIPHSLAGEPKKLSLVD